MARDFFTAPATGQVPVSGSVISDLQRSLNALGGTLTVDGLYGKGTSKAIADFQAAHGLPQSGNVSDATWQALMRTPEPKIFDRCLQLVASFEGTGFTLVVGNFDGAGITWGIIGFTLVNGELGEVLQEINQSHPDLIGTAFGHDADTILKITGPATSEADKTAWANSVSRGASSYNVAEPWKTYFHDLGTFREVQSIQVARAKTKYWTIAMRDAGKLGIAEELDYLLVYDTAVQNGGLSKTRLGKVQDLINEQHPKTAEDKRKIIANVVADSSSAKYREDVRSRKLTIATGAGTVHGGKYQLAQWGFLDGQSTASAD